MEDVEEEIIFQDDVSSGEVPVPFPISMLDLAAAAAEEEEDGVEDMEGETLPHILVEEEEHCAAAAALQAEPMLLDNVDMPADGIVVLLPLTGITDEPIGPPPARLMDAGRCGTHHQLGCGGGH
ncbi:hypothetical protein [Sporisorium scitamineum]|uniref:Uncharacterized protein n=1 Tax=Sporisorium scitamineum TaxID=49012 RepID=A0A0F7RVJ9_9BASI|nr:hypothetical protein [Sporisorium scitamineum]